MASNNKNKKLTHTWFKCEKCESNINQKETEHHSLYCPPSLVDFQHSFIAHGVFYGYLNVKTNEDIKGITNHDKNNMLYLSQSAIQLLNLVIGEWAVIKTIDSKRCNARIVWPTTEKSMWSILVTQTDLELNWDGKADTKVSVHKFDISSVKIAKEIILLALNATKNLQFTQELILRIKKLHLHRLITNGNKINVFFYGKELEFQIHYVEPTLNESIIQENHIKNLHYEFDKLDLSDVTQFYKINNTTTFRLYGDRNEIIKATKKVDPFDRIGGLKNEIDEICDLVKIALGKTCMVEGMRCTKGILLYGASGTGKTMVSRAIAESLNTRVVSITGSDVYSKYSGETETIIKNLFKEAVDNAPSVILLDEIDLLCPVRSSRITDQEKRVVASLLNQFDELNDERICIIATSNRPDYIDPAFRRTGRLDREIEIPIPNPVGRLEILQKILRNVTNRIDDVSLKEIADASYGFVGSDLESLCSRAAIHAVKRSPMNSVLSFEDLKYALTRVRPSAMREVQIEVPNVKWGDIGGQDELKLVLKQAVEWPLKHPESFIRMGITPPRGVLMFGPPGCSKTMIAKALATESGLNFLSIKGPELFNKWVGESERAVREVFRKARQVAPSIIFFDEIDALGGERSSGSSGGTSVQERVLAQLLTELDGVTPLGDVTVLAATNRPDRIDKALLRPGRLDRIVYVPLPDEKTREEIFKIKLSKMPIDDTIKISDLVGKTDKYSGAEVQAVCHEAAMKALEFDINARYVSFEHFEKALKMITPRTPDSLLKIYEDYLK